MGQMQAKTLIQESEVNHPQYSVYVYHYPEQIELGHTDWEMKRMTGSRYRALKLAQKYHDSAAYHRVEVKKKYFDQKCDRMVDATMKVLEAEKTQMSGARIVMLCGAVLCGGAAVVAGLFLI